MKVKNKERFGSRNAQQIIRYNIIAQIIRPKSILIVIFIMILYILISYLTHL